MNRDGRGVDPGEDTTPNLGYFFKLIFRKFSNLITLNLMMFAMALPIAVAVYVFFNGPQMPTMSSPAYSALFSGCSISLSFVCVLLYSFVLPCKESVPPQWFLILLDGDIHYLDGVLGIVADE